MLSESQEVRDGRVATIPPGFKQLVANMIGVTRWRGEHARAEEVGCMQRFQRAHMARQG